MSEIPGKFDLRLINSLFHVGHTNIFVYKRVLTVFLELWLNQRAKVINSLASNVNEL